MGAPHHWKEVLEPALAGLEGNVFLWKKIPSLNMELEDWEEKKEHFLTPGVEIFPVKVQVFFFWRRRLVLLPVI